MGTIGENVTDRIEASGSHLVSQCQRCSVLQDTNQWSRLNKFLYNMGKCISNGHYIKASMRTKSSSWKVVLKNKTITFHINDRGSCAPNMQFHLISSASRLLVHLFLRVLTSQTYSHLLTWEVAEAYRHKI